MLVGKARWDSVRVGVGSLEHEQEERGRKKNGRENVKASNFHLPPISMPSPDADGISRPASNGAF